NRGAAERCSTSVKIMCQPPDRFGEQAPALLEILEHVQAGAGWRQQHYVTRLGRISRGSNGLFDRVNADDRYGIAQRLAQLGCIAPKQYRSATIAADRLTQGSEIGALAITAGDQHVLAIQSRAKAVDCGQCGADVGSLGVVVIIYVGMF